MTKRKEQHYEVQVTDENDVLKITALGAGNEVGRSCVVIQYKGKTVMVLKLIEISIQYDYVNSVCT